MHSSILQTPLPDGRIRCDVCQWRCELAPGERGRCRVRERQEQTIALTSYGQISAATIGPIEDQRLWHFFPDAQALSIGGFGTPITAGAGLGTARAFLEPSPSARKLDPERAVIFAQQRLCRGILWAFGDPAVNAEWVLDGLKISRAASRFNAIATTGYFNPEVFAQMTPYLDGMRLDIFGFSSQSYRELSGLDDWRTIFKNAAEARQKWNIHIEVALYLTPGVNDSDAEITALSKWMRVALGSLTPLHILGDQIDEATLHRVQTAARSAGMQFVYGPAAAQSTRCPTCTWVVIERSEGPTQLTGVIDDVCESCHMPLGLRTSLFRRNVRYEMPTSIA